MLEVFTMSQMEEVPNTTPLQPSLVLWSLEASFTSHPLTHHYNTVPYTTYPPHPYIIHTTSMWYPIIWFPYLYGPMENNGATIAKVENRKPWMTTTGALDEG